MTEPDWIARSPHAAIIYALRTVAWADGVLDELELIWSAQLLERLGVPIDRDVFRHWMNTANDDVAPEEADTFNQLFLLTEAIGLAWADGVYQSPERDRIARWARAWSVTDTQLEALEAEVAASQTLSGSR